ncbi:MAG: phosphoesterase [Clostridia bacterium]|nr:phosphoesterase [Clostridia bacterium]
MNLRYDLHIHSALSPCGDLDMTPNNIVNMAMLCELDMIAVADHNTTGNIEAVIEVGKAAGITVVPAMELETAEEIHVLCLFPDAASAKAFDRDVVMPALPDMENDVKIFGEQLLMDAQDQVVGEEKRYLLNATQISLDDLPALITPYGGVAVPAHIDKQTKSLVGNFGMVGAYMGFGSFELSRNLQDGFIEGTPGLGARSYRYIHDSDAHYLQDIGEHSGENLIDLDANTPTELIKYLKNEENRPKN